MTFRVSIVCVCIAMACALASVATPAQAPTRTQWSSPSRPLLIDGVDRSGIPSFAPEIRAVDLDGLRKLLQRDPNDSRPLLVNFWATWCDGCREEFPDLVKIDNDYRAKGLNFLSVTLDDLEDKGKAAEFLQEMKATMPVVLLNVKDPEPAIHVIDDKWSGELPATFLYDRQGQTIFRHFGKIKPDELRAVLDKVTSNK